MNLPFVMLTINLRLDIINNTAKEYCAVAVGYYVTKSPVNDIVVVNFNVFAGACSAIHRHNGYGSAFNTARVYV